MLNGFETIKNKIQRELWPTVLSNWSVWGPGTCCYISFLILKITHKKTRTKSTIGEFLLYAPGLSCRLYPVGRFLLEYLPLDTGQ